MRKQRLRVQGSNTRIPCHQQISLLALWHVKESTPLVNSNCPVFVQWVTSNGHPRVPSTVLFALVPICSATAGSGTGSANGRCAGGNFRPQLGAFLRHRALAYVGLGVGFRWLNRLTNQNPGLTIPNRDLMNNGHGVSKKGTHTAKCPSNGEDDNDDNEPVDIGYTLRAWANPHETSQNGPGWQIPSSLPCR